MTALVISACEGGPAPASGAESQSPPQEVTADKASDEVMAEKEGEAMMEDNSNDAMMTETETGGDTMKEEEAMAVPAWFNAELTNLNTGETFKITDFKGKVVLVETMVDDIFSKI